jgi:hypothetical protein
MDKPWKVISAFVGVFVAGAVFGGLFTLRTSSKRWAAEQASLAAAKAPSVVVVDQKQPSAAPTALEQPAKTASQPGPQAPKPQDRIVPAVMNQMTRRLNPTAEQKEKIRPLIARATEDIQRLTREHWQDTTRVTERMYEDIAALLSTEQRVQLENMRQEALERVRKAREKQRDEAQAKGSARPAKPLTPEGANPGR